MIRLRTDVALALHQRQQHTAASEEPLQIANNLGVVLEPLHPDAEARYLFPCSEFQGEGIELCNTKMRIARLNHCKAIEAAYLKPLDEML